MDRDRILSFDRSKHIEPLRLALDEVQSVQLRTQELDAVLVGTRVVLQMRCAIHDGYWAEERNSVKETVISSVRQLDTRYGFLQNNHCQYQ